MNSTRTRVALIVLSIAMLATFPMKAEDKEAITLSLDIVAFNVPDIAEAEKYYVEVFGFKRTGQYPPQGDPIEIFMTLPGSSGATLALAKLNNDPLPEGKGRYGRIILNTNDARAIAKKAEAAGSTNMREIDLPGDNPPVIIFFNDPNGYEIELYQAP